MKKAVAIVLFLSIVLAGCRAVPVDPTDGTTQLTSGSAASVPESAPSSIPETTTASVPESTAAFQTENAKLAEAIRKYSWVPFPGVFTYDGERPDLMIGPRYDFDEEEERKLVEGYTYIYHTDEKKCYLLVENRELSWATKEHIFVTTSHAPNVLFRMDHYGNDRTVIYKSPGERINRIIYMGTDENGKVLLIEDNARAVLVDIPTGEAQILLEEEGLVTFQIVYEAYYDDFRYIYQVGGDLWKMDPATGEQTEIIFGD